MRFRGIFAIVVWLAPLGMSQREPMTEWNLRVSLGQDREEVRRVLGPPNETIPGSLRAVSPEAAADFVRRFPGQTMEYYYSSGLVGRYDRNLLFGITVPARADYQGWITHSDPIVGGVRVSDSKQEILRKLGTPTKIEDDPIEAGVDLDRPVVWPAQSRFYWRRQNYTVEIGFLRQAQSIDRDIVAAKDDVTVVLLYK